MRPTRFGWIFLFLAALTLSAALASGNNLLYLLYALMASALVLSPIALKASLAGLRVEPAAPEHIVSGAPFRLRLRFFNGGRLAARFLRVRCGPSEAGIGEIAPGGERAVSLPLTLPRRGRNAVDISWESAFPFGLLRIRTENDPLILAALPRPAAGGRVLQGEEEGAGAEGARPRRGSGDEPFGVRTYDPADEVRLINWKLSARSGKILVNEFARPGASRVTVRLRGGLSPDEEEKSVSEAAGACSAHIESGAEVRLITPETEVPHGKGLPHLTRLLSALAVSGAGAAARRVGHGAGKNAPDSVSRRLLRLTNFGGALVFSSLFLIEDVNPWLVAATGPAILWGWRLDRGGGRRLPEWIWRLASCGMLAYTLLYNWRLQGITLANTHLLLYLLVNQALHPKTHGTLNRMFMIYFLAFFLISGQTISLWYFLSFLLFSAFAAGWLALVELEGAEPGAPFPFPAVSAALALGLALTGPAFAVTPRFDPLARFSGIFADMGLDKRTPKSDFVTGFSENVSLGFFGHLKKSSARILRIKPLRQGGTSPPLLELHVRGSSFDHFDGRRWSKTSLDFRYTYRSKTLWSANGRAWALREGSQLIFPGGKAGAVPAMEFTIAPFNSSVLFTHAPPLMIEQAAGSVYFDFTDTVYFSAPYTGGTSYRIAAREDSPLTFSAFFPDFQSSLANRFLQLPELDGRIGELSANVTRSADTPLKKTRAVERYLQRAYAYSTYSDDPHRDLAGFLFESHAGNCEYFASAAAVLLRKAGVPARLVTGFLVSLEDWNEYGKFYDVRQSQAHAWTEAYIEGLGWITVDATPPENSLAARAGAAAARLRRLFNAIQARWYRAVIGYDRSSQRDTFFHFKLSLSAPGAASRLGSLARQGAPWAALAALAAALKRMRREKGGRKKDSLFDRALALLKRTGLSKPAFLTPREFARGKAARERPGLAPLLTELAELHYLERYSGRPLGRADAARADELLRELRTRISSLS